MSKHSYTIEDLRKRGVKPLMSSLVLAAISGRKVPYGAFGAQLARKLGVANIFPIHIGKVAGALMDKLQKYDARLPLINALVVHNDDGLPGAGMTGYFTHRYGSKYARYEYMSLDANRYLKFRKRPEAPRAATQITHARI